MIRRLTSSSFAGISRKLVAVGTARLASMLVTIRAAAPLMATPSGSTAGGAALAGVGSAGGGAGASVVGGGAVTGAGAASADEPLVR